MENWGLITYRESALLYQPGRSSLSDREYVAVVVAHELSHQWFGNLVTMEWWTDLWLNEGFAAYTEFIGTQHVSPETQIIDRFVLDNLQPVSLSTITIIKSNVKFIFIAVCTYIHLGNGLRLPPHLAPHFHPSQRA